MKERISNWLECPRYFSGKTKKNKKKHRDEEDERNLRGKFNWYLLFRFVSVVIVVGWNFEGLVEKLKLKKQQN